MAFLYVANCTQQQQIIFYRTDIAPPGAQVPFTASRQQAIPPGRQMTVGGDLDQHEIGALVEYLNQFGAVGEVDVPGKLHPMVHPFIFNIDRPVSEHAMRHVMAHNMGIKIEEGDERRERAAVGANEALDIAAQRSGVPDPRQFDVEFEQMELTADEKRVEQGFHVNRDPTQAPQKRGPGRPRKVQ
jgi:hypothetical protein